MSLELKIRKELGTLTATAYEWYGYYSIVNSKVRSGEFHRLFNKMIFELVDIYGLVTDGLAPFVAIESEEQFAASFDSLQEEYQNNFLQLASKPRHHCDAAYEEFLLFSIMKDYKTGYPLLKRTYESMDTFVDKWVTNDAWIVMSMDVVFKSLNRLLLEISTLKKQDLEDAWLVYQQAFAGFSPQLEMLKSCRELYPEPAPTLQQAAGSH